LSLFVDTSVWSLAFRRDAPAAAGEPRRDHVDAADLRNNCRRGGVQIGTIDALLAQLCLRHDLTMLTSDRVFHNIARHCALKLWTVPT
jgi:predicted nucleic acid-binding protein